MQCYGQWEKVNGINSSNAITGLIKINGNLLCGTNCGEIYKYDYVENNWTLVSNVETDGYLNAFYKYENELYLLTKKGLYLSNDYGLTWLLIFDQGVGSVVKYHNIIFLTYSKGLLKSDNSGRSWQKINSNLPSEKMTSVNENNGVLYLLIPTRGLFISLDMGNTWSFQMFNFSSSTSKLKFYQNEIYCASNYCLFMSIDTGRTWKCIFNVVDKETQSLYSYDFENTELYVSSSLGLFKYNRINTNSWSVVDTLIHPYITNFQIDQNELVAMNTDIYFSKDGGISWRANSSGIGSENIVELISNDSVSFASSRTNEILKSTNDGSTWINHLFNPKVLNTWNISASVINHRYSLDSIYLYSYNKKFIYRSLDYGINWDSIKIADGQRVFHFAAAHGHLISASGSGIYFSTDNGQNWIENINGLYSIAVDFLTIHDTIALIHTGDGLYAKGFNEESWTELFTGIEHPNSIKFIFTNNSNTYFATDSMLYRSYKLNYSWHPVPEFEHRKVVAMASKDSLVFVATDNGVYFSDNNGVTFLLMDDELICKKITSLSLTKNYLLAGTAYGGIWRRPLYQFTRVIEAPKDDRIEALTVIPNPVVSKAKFEYYLSKTSSVSIDIFNVDGVKIDNLFSGLQSSGKHNIEWDTNSATFGIFVCVLKTQDSVRATKFVLKN